MFCKITKTIEIKHYTIHRNNNKIARGFMRLTLQFVLKSKDISDQFGSNVSNERKRSLTSLYNSDVVYGCVEQFRHFSV